MDDKADRKLNEAARQGFWLGIAAGSLVTAAIVGWTLGPDHWLALIPLGAFVLGALNAVPR